jgi:hypothetical protein
VKIWRRDHDTSWGGKAFDVALSDAYDDCTWAQPDHWREECLHARGGRF